MVKSRLWIEKNGKNFLGHGKIELLEKIEEYGSINAAAKAMKMSYKAAWDAIDSINNLAKTAVVLKVGNGSKLSDEGKRLISKFRGLEKKIDEFISQFDDDLEISAKNLSMLSAKNQFIAVVRGVRSDSVGADLELYINKNITIFSNITKDSLSKLKIGVDSAVIAIIKANSIKISKTKPKCANAIKCEILNIKQGEKLTQISLKSNDINLTSTMKNSEFGKFSQNEIVYAYFDASSVMIGK